MGKARPDLKNLLLEREASARRSFPECRKLERLAKGDPDLPEFGKDHL
jgi:hypothetical protein